MKKTTFDYATVENNTDTTGKKKNPNAAATPLLITTIIKRIISLFVNTFFVAHLATNSGTYIRDISIFFIVGYTVFGLGYFAISYIVDKTNRITMHRIAILFNAVFITVIVLLGKELVKYVALVGVFFGLAEALYWGTFNVLKNEMVKQASMHKFSLMIIAFEQGVKIIIPILLGLLIDSSSFYSATFYVLGLAIIQVIASFFVKSLKPVNSHFSMKGFFKTLKKKPIVAKKLKQMYITNFFYGFTSILSTLISIVTIMTFKTNVNLGILSSVFAAGAIVFLLIFRATTSSSRNKWWLLATALLPIFGVVGLLINISRVTLIIYNCAIVLAGVVPNYIFDLHRNTVLKQHKLYGEIAEHHTMIELIFATSRVLSYGAMFIVSLFNSVVALQVLLAVSVLSLTLSSLSLIKYEKLCKELDAPCDSEISEEKIKL